MGIEAINPARPRSAQFCSTGSRGRSVVGPPGGQITGWGGSGGYGVVKFQIGPNETAPHSLVPATRQ